MIAQDKIITALTPGSPFNIHNRIWRSIESLAGYTGMAPEQVLDILTGDLSSQVAVKPGKKNSLMVALKSNALQPVIGATEPEMVTVAGGNAFVAADPQPLTYVGVGQEGPAPVSHVLDTDGDDEDEFCEDCGDDGCDCD